MLLGLVASNLILEFNLLLEVTNMKTFNSKDLKKKLPAIIIGLVILLYSVFSFAQGLALNDIIDDRLRKEIEKHINNKIPNKLFDQSGIKIDGSTDLQLKIYKNGRINTAIRRGGIVLTIPLRFTARADWKTEKRIKFGFGSKGFTVRHHENTSGALTVFAKTRLLDIGCQGIKSRTTAVFRWNEKPYITVGPVRIRISSIAGNAIHSQLNKLANRVDVLINDKTINKIRAFLGCDR